MSLNQEINERRQQLSVDAYSMSVGEIANMYDDGELNIFPNFQRFYRWTIEQKSRLIESLLLGIPLPSIFVSQREDGVWDVVDGLQRLSTILQFMGKLRDIDNKPIERLILKGTKQLPSLDKKVYQDENEQISFSDEHRRLLKRAKLDIVILKRESDEFGKYELFQRLNTGGTSLTFQEIRNCLMVMENKEWFSKFESLLSNDNFKSTISLNDKYLNERYDAELLTRFLCLRRESMDNLGSIGDLEAYLDNKIIDLVNNKEFDWDTEIDIFNRTFLLIDKAMGDEAFCRYVPSENRFKGNFLTGAYEFVAISLGRKNGNVPEKFDLRQRLIELWTTEIGNERWQGANASSRLQKTLKLGEMLYSDVKN